MPDFKVKMKLVSVLDQGMGQQQLEFEAVPGGDPGKANADNTFAKDAPAARLHVYITNPDMVGKFKTGSTYTGEFTDVDPSFGEPKEG